MLQELHIRNFAIIDDLHLIFGPGLNILTGETGAGKSIIIDAVGLLLGDRASDEWVRAGCDRAEIEATFHLPPSRGEGTDDVTLQVRQILQEQELEDPESEEWLLLSREVRLNGRNICRINGRIVNLQTLSDVAALLVDVHGQGEHLNLLRPRTHIYLLDRYAGLMTERQAIAAEVAQLRKVRTELQRLNQDARMIAQRVDLLTYQADEIAAADLQVGEDVELESERTRLSNAETLMMLSQSAQVILSEGDDGAPGAVDLVSEAVGRLEKLARIDGDMQEMATACQGLLEQLADIARDLQDYADNLEFNPDRLVLVEERLELIASFKRKYGDTIDEIIAFGERAQAELDELGDWEVKTAALEEEEERLLQTIGTLSAQLSQKRAQAGVQMAHQIEKELAALRMDRAHFGLAVEQTAREDGAYLPDGRRVAFDSTGVDRVEFMISANPGEPLKPMTKVASGGETARLMLALKSVLANADATPTLIFDEIDQGIGGRVGAVVGQKLWGLTGAPPAKAKGTNSKVKHQVLCITHLPQLAAYGDQHFTVNKRVIAENGQERTSTVVTHLDDGQRIEELMQMLGAVTDAGRRSVEEMISEVAQVKGGRSS